MSYCINNVSAIPPVASIISYAGSSSPNGWLICNGSSVSRTTYSDLFNVIGITYGEGDGSTTFTLPDLINKVIRGGVPGNIVSGQDTIFINTSNLPSHNHTYYDAAFIWHNSGGGNTVDVGAGAIGVNNDQIQSTGYSTWRTSDPDTTTNSASYSQIQTALNTGNSGSGDSISIIPKNLIMYFIIKY